MSSEFSDLFIKDVSFFMNDNWDFVYIDPTGKILEKHSKYSKKQEQTLIKNAKACPNKKMLDGRHSLPFYARPNAGIAHEVSKLTTYLKFARNRRSNVCIPSYISGNILKLITPVFNDRIRILEPNILYTCCSFMESPFFNVMGDPNITKPDNKLPLIVANNEMYWFRAQINQYVDSLPPKQPFDKIFVGKFEGQGQGTCENATIVKPRSLLGCIPVSLLSRFESNGFVNIDPYNYNIIDIIWYLRHAKEVIISCGTAAYLYLPYLKRSCKLHYMINVTAEAGIVLGNLSYDYNKQADLVHRFFPNEYEIHFYKYAPHYDLGVRECNKYTGDDMLEFLSTEA